MSRWLNSFQSTAALLLRLVLGSCLAYFGYHKVIPHGALDGFVHMIVGLHLPACMAYISAFTEFFGGILLILGLLTRFVAALAAINMLFVFFLVGIHGQPNMYFWHLSLAANAIMLLTYGPGALSVDRRLGLN